VRPYSGKNITAGKYGIPARKPAVCRRALKKSVRNDVFNDGCTWCGTQTWCDCSQYYGHDEYDLDEWDDAWWPIECNCLECRLFDAYHPRPSLPKSSSMMYSLADKLARVS